jgi:predicted nucleic acid-binding protein
LATVVVEVHPSYLWRAQLGDPDDDMVLEAAINGRADAIVTFNVRDFGVVPGRFNIRVLRPGDALAGLVK